MISTSCQPIRRCGRVMACGAAALFATATVVSAQETIEPAAKAAETSYQDSNAISCTLPSACTVTFNKIPRNKRVHLTRVSCGIATPVNIGFSQAIIESDSGFPTKDSNFIVPTLIGADATNFSYHLNQAIGASFGPGQIPVAHFEFIGSTAGIASALCNISGTIGPK